MSINILLNFIRDKSNWNGSTPGYGPGPSKEREKEIEAKVPCWKDVVANPNNWNEINNTLVQFHESMDDYWVDWFCSKIIENGGVEAMNTLYDTECNNLKDSIEDWIYYNYILLLSKSRVEERTVLNKYLWEFWKDVNEKIKKYILTKVIEKYSTSSQEINSLEEITRKASDKKNTRRIVIIRIKKMKTVTRAAIIGAIAAITAAIIKVFIQ